MKRFFAWYRWTWQSNLRLFVGIALASVLAAWSAVLLFKYDIRRIGLEGVNLGLFTLGLMLLAAGMLNAERRAGAESMLLRLPSARLPALVGRLAFLLSAGALHFFFLALCAGLLCDAYEIVDHSLVPYDLVRDWIVFPRWIVADLVPVGLAFGAFGLLASAWTRKSALAVVIALFLPLLLAFPLFRLYAERPDFIDLQRRGAPNLVAWPFVLLGLLAAVVAWTWGRRFLNRPRRAFLLGMAVLVIGGLLGTGFTAYALARFDAVDPRASDFRLATHAFRASANHIGGRPVVLGAGGRYLYVQGYRYIRGTWPNPPRESYKAEAPHFLEDRGTRQGQWRIDLETGEATRVGAGRDRISFRELGLVIFPLIPHHRDSGVYAPTAHALLGTPGEGDDVRLIDLRSGQVDPLPSALWGDDHRRRVHLIAASVSPVRDASGRSVWLRRGGEFRDRHLEITWIGGSKKVDASVLRESRRRHLMVRGWVPCPGGWWQTFGPDLATIEAATGKMRLRDWRQSAWSGFPICLSPTKALIAAGHVDGTTEWRYRLIDMDGGEEVERKWVDSPRVSHLPLPDGRLLSLVFVPGVNEQHLRLWDPVTHTQESVRMPKDLGGSSTQQGGLSVFGSDRRGNTVILWRTFDWTDAQSMEASMLQRLVVYRHATKSAVALGSWTNAEVPFALEIIGIDEKDRVVALESDGDGTGFKRVVRLGPEEGQREVVFPRP